jgi:hypothetical protein
MPFIPDQVQFRNTNHYSHSTHRDMAILYNIAHGPTITPIFKTTVLDWGHGRRKGWVWYQTQPFLLPCPNYHICYDSNLYGTSIIAMNNWFANHRPIPEFSSGSQAIPEVYQVTWLICLTECSIRLLDCCWCWLTSNMPSSSPVAYEALFTVLVIGGD